MKPIRIKTGQTFSGVGYTKKVKAPKNPPTYTTKKKTTSEETGINITTK